ncbi:YrhK family protein [Nocardioides albus]|uniref:YrhK domain-containing protein n=1 Tax=Nocardioides albus TaxID=1841 RepID=A0A7W5A765_9ACTN|nr:YrhK family protein [Nocardioides albus]MBB3090847.1 hypothetical protein [Nocardioides albus]GGU37884.1 hypothetical protein GCM10007979_41210 [Nocardioides albus]
MVTYAETPHGYGDETFALFEHVNRATTYAWRVVHGLSFLVGGTTFIVGTVLYFYPQMENVYLYSGILYIIGSLGFLLVDLLEFFTYTDDRGLRINIALSMSGSAAYVIGSYGFLPSVYESNKNLGPWGFIIGSALIFASQSWKVARIVRGEADQGRGEAVAPLVGRRFGFRLRSCAKTGLGVEANAAVGGLMFFIGTVMYVARVPEGAYFTSIILLWLLGSLFFTTGSLFLNYRHFAMKLCR